VGRSRAVRAYTVGGVSPDQGAVLGSPPPRRWWQLRRRRPTTAFVLSGGGNKGAAQVGMLSELVRRRIEADFLVGSSVGGINAAAYSADPTPAGVARLAEVWLRTKGEDIFPRGRFGGRWQFIQKGQAVYRPDGLRRMIEEFLDFSELEDAPVPLELVASSLSDGRERWLSRGPAVEALLATCALPGVFPPVHIEGDELIDGGVLNDVPLLRALARGASRVFVLLCRPLRHAPVRVERPIEAILAAFSLAIDGRFTRELEMLPGGVEVVVIGADLPRDQDFWDFSRTAEFIEAGRASAAEVLDAYLGGGRPARLAEPWPGEEPGVSLVVRADGARPAPRRPAHHLEAPSSPSQR